MGLIYKKEFCVKLLRNSASNSASFRDDKVQRNSASDSALFREDKVQRNSASNSALFREARSAGFTLIEILLVIALIAIVTGVILPIARNFQIRNDLDIGAAMVVGAFRRAGVRAQGMDGDFAWGVNVATSTITLFRGTSFASRNTNFDEVDEIASTIRPSGLTEVVFSKFTGNPVATGTASLRSSDNELRTVTINERGMVDY